jgi:hypothetical protein
MPLYLFKERVKMPSPTVKALTIGTAHKKEAAHLLSRNIFDVHLSTMSHPSINLFSDAAQGCTI